MKNIRICINTHIWINIILYTTYIIIHGKCDVNTMNTTSIIIFCVVKTIVTNIYFALLWYFEEDIKSMYLETIHCLILILSMNIQTIVIVILTFADFS